jgi:ribosomal protein S18 acetylase RimI-like enzyme
VASPPIVRLGVEDAGELLTLQRGAYVTEAQAHGDPGLPPLLQTLAELRDELACADVVALGIRDRGRLVASVRVRHDAAHPGVAELARLAVAPDRQGEGMGTRLLREAERHIRPGVSAIVLFTGEHSHGNLRLYEHHGYVETHRTPAGTHDLVHMCKAIGERRAYTPPHTSSAVSTTSRSFAISSSIESRLPSTVDENPHCGERQS